LARATSVLEPAARLAVGEIDRARLSKVGRQQHIEQAALTGGGHFGHAGDGLRQLSVLVDDAQAPRALGNQHAPIGEKLQAPGVLEALGDALDFDPARLGRRWSVGDNRRGRPGCDIERSRQRHSDPSNSIEH